MSYVLHLTVERDDPELDELHEMTGIPRTKGSFEFEGDFPTLTLLLDFLESFVEGSREQVPDEL